LRRGYPRAYSGERIGLFGGSFDPAHEGHAHVAETALKRLDLDRIWWLVSPQNPLKPKSGPFAERVASARAMAHGRKMVVTDIESRVGAKYTFETVRALKRLYPQTRFTLIIGADSLAGFKKWKNWREIAQSVPIAVISRPEIGPIALSTKLKSMVFLRARHHAQSSSAIRAGRGQ
jgi:nicotinate-nucleotide adenylyltransferase